MSGILRNRYIFLFIVTAFLAVQWSSAHIHPPAHHEHGGSGHKHQATLHLHKAANHHADVIDIAHADTHDDVVELEHACTPPASFKLGDLADLAQGYELSVQFLDVPDRFTAPIVEQFGSTWLGYSNVRSRAPPRFIS